LNDLQNSAGTTFNDHYEVAGEFPDVVIHIPNLFTAGGLSFRNIFASRLAESLKHL